MNYEAMQKRNIFDRSIVNQPEIEYRKAKPPFVIKHKAIDGESGEEKHGTRHIALFASGMENMVCGTV